jgi:homoserine O-acetyltransferase/O-succinyltransferase
MIIRLILLALLSTATVAAGAQAAPSKWPTQDGTYDIANFHFKDGETIEKLHLHYLTLGKPHRDAAGHTDNVVLLLHGTGGNAHSLMSPVFSDVLFGPGQPLDITKYYIILPDDIGHGQSSKPSDGLRMKFPQYDYDDMIASQHTMLVDGLHVDHLHLILGTSMGCMQSFVWGETFPQFMDALAPFACNAVPIAGRNRMTRYMAIQAIRDDPNWKNGDYTTPPVEGMRAAESILMIMSSVPLQLQKHYPTQAAAETYVDDYLKRTVATTDANDLIYYFNASRNYDPGKKLSTITAPLLWINSADDFVNPPELGLAQVMVKDIPHGKFILIPISDATRGHGTHTQAAVWKQYLIDFLAETEKK